MSMSSLILIIVIAICIEDLELKRESLDIKTKEVFTLIDIIRSSADSSAYVACHMSRKSSKKSTVAAAQLCVKNNQIALDKCAEVDDFIAELCISAPSDSVKFFLRIYEYGKSVKQIEKEIDRESRETLDETAKYLKIPNYEMKTKKPLAHLIVCRLQNLLPENCNICQDRYKIALGDSALLECAICGQGVHRKCYTELAAATIDTGVCDLVFSKDMNAEEFNNVWNPLKLPGVLYLCEVCQDNVIPSDDAGNRKTRKKVEINLL